MNLQLASFSTRSVITDTISSDEFASCKLQYTQCHHGHNLLSDAIIDSMMGKLAYV